MLKQIVELINNKRDTGRKLSLMLQGAASVVTSFFNSSDSLVKLQHKLEVVSNEEAGVISISAVGNPGLFYVRLPNDVEESILELVEEKEIYYFIATLITQEEGFTLNKQIFLDTLFTYVLFEDTARDDLLKDEE